MYFFVDESGHTGANLFDEDQPVLYYGVLLSRFDVENIASSAVEEMRNLLGVDRLHAAELGVEKLSRLAPNLIPLQESLDLYFDFYRVHNIDHAAICFFDQVFDQGVNRAVPWSAYWTPLRYMLLLKVSALFDIELLKKAWNARIESSDELAERELIYVCQVLTSRVNILTDERSREIIRDSLAWAIENPKEIRYNAKDKKELHWVTPNLIGFQSVMFGIASRITENHIQSPIIIIDQQSQFNKSQRTLADFYAEASGEKFELGTGLPDYDFTGMPTTPIIFQSSSQSVGLELVDIYLWLFKRFYEERVIPDELWPIIEYQFPRGKTDQVSIDGIAGRWASWFDELPEPTGEQLDLAKELIEKDERRRLTAIQRSNKKIND